DISIEHGNSSCWARRAPLCVTNLTITSSDGADDLLATRSYGRRAVADDNLNAAVLLPSLPRVVARNPITLALTYCGQAHGAHALSDEVSLHPGRATLR